MKFDPFKDMSVSFPDPYVRYAEVMIESNTSLLLDVFGLHGLDDYEKDDLVVKYSRSGETLRPLTLLSNGGSRMTFKADEVVSHTLYIIKIDELSYSTPRTAGFSIIVHFRYG